MGGSRRRAVLLLASVIGLAAAIAVVVVTRGDEPAKRSDHESRTREPPPKPEPSISIAWVGDISVSTRLGLPGDPDRELFGRVRGPLRASDVTAGNLEGTLGSGGTSKCKPNAEDCFTFQAPASYAGVFRRAGFDVMNVANNHSYDYGASGYGQTLAALEGARLEHTGRPGQVLVRRVGEVRVAFAGFAPYQGSADLRDTNGARRLVARARRRADVVVVLMHAGAEGSDKTHTPVGTEVAFGENRGDTRGFAHAAVDAGADLVLGSGPHVVRGIERYRGRLIAYSLGNFLGYRSFSTEGALALSGILGVKLDSSGRLLSGRWTSIRLDGTGVPHVDNDFESARLVRSLSRQDFGRRAYPISARGELTAPRSPR